MAVQGGGGRRSSGGGTSKIASPINGGTIGMGVTGTSMAKTRMRRHTDAGRDTDPDVNFSGARGQVFGGQPGGTAVKINKG